MNDQILELAEQCTTQYQDGHGNYMDQVDVEKFAELIIRECAARIQGCHLAEGYDPNIVGDFELGYQRAIDKASSQVLLHFGIEE